MMERASRHALDRARERLGIRLPDADMVRLLDALWGIGAPMTEEDFAQTDARRWVGREYRAAT